MKRKLWLSVCAASCAALCACGLVACGQKGSGDKEDAGNGVQITEQLRYQKISGKEEYRVMGMGTVSDLDIVIPATYRGLPVTEIGSGVFKEEYYITSVTIPDSVTSIGDSAFEDCSSLTSVTIPNGVTSIGDSAFYGCSSLTGVTIGNGVTSIGSSAFSGCSSLQYNVKDNLKYLGNINNPYVYLADTSSTSITTATIEDGCKVIGNSAFEDCSSLTSVTIPNGVTSIGSFAFYGCNSLTGVTIGNGVTSIGSFAFEDCCSLTSVYITDIEAWCNVEFGDVFGNPLYYAKNLYLNNELVTELVIPDTVTEIKAYAFHTCESLTSIEIPDSVTSIGYSAFYSCWNLTSVYITDIEAWCNISFEEDFANPLYSAENLYLNNVLVTELVIPDTVTEIKAYAFSSCYSLTSVTIGNSVTSIGDSAFEGCSSLASVTIPDSVTSIGDSAFEGCYSLTSVTFKNPNGWWYSSPSTETSGTSISSDSLSDPSTAARFLTLTYMGYWKRS